MAESAGQTFGIDWGMVGAAIAFFGIVVGAAITLVLYQHGQLLAQVKDQEDRARIRAKLTSDAGIATRFRDGIAGLITRIDGYFGPRLGWRAFDRCLLHAYLYPILLFVAAWVAGGGGALGIVTVFGDVNALQRLWIFVALILAVSSIFVVAAITGRILAAMRAGIGKVRVMTSSAIGRSVLRTERVSEEFTNVITTVAILGAGAGATAYATASGFASAAVVAARLIVAGERPRAWPIALTLCPSAFKSAIRSRSSTERWL